MSEQSRLSHPLSALIRALQMSTAQVVVFVEGRDDRPFYSKLCESVLASRGVAYDVKLAQELPGQLGSGKEALLVLHEWLRRRSALFSVLEGKATTVLFFVDKDVDDIVDRVVNSDHLIRTEYYCAENYCFRHGDLTVAVCEAASLDAQSVSAVVPGDNDEWTRGAAVRWKEWVKICVFAAVRARSVRNYRCQQSRVHSGPYAAVDRSAVTREFEALRRACGLTAIGFKRVFNRLGREIEKLYEEGDYDRVFNGKWYAQFLAADAAAAAGGRVYSSRALPTRLVAHLRQTLSYDDSWAQHFKIPLQAAADAVIAA